MSNRLLPILLAFLAACGDDDDRGPLDAGLVPDGSPPADAPLPDGAPPVDAGLDAGPSGRWTTGDFHVHTVQSNDSPSLLTAVLEAAFTRNQLDWITLSNHLRLSEHDSAGNTIAGIPFSLGLELHELPALAALREAGLYTDKTIFSAVEWDMPTHEHFVVGILADAPGSPPDVEALAEFEYRFTSRDAALFDPADVARWGPQRFHTTHADALEAIAWLAERYPGRSYGIVAHPSRNPNRYAITDFRELHDLAPEVVFTIEGMLGNQMEPDRGGYASPYTEENRRNRTYGGCDFVIAELGGVWDALLGEGRRIWNVGNSDYHFKLAQGMYSSGYTPGEYSKNHVWVEGEGMAAILAGLRSGKLFSATGELISALDFVAAAAGERAEMGGTLAVERGATVTLTIRFRSDVPSHYESPVGSGHVPGDLPEVDHVDLIVGDVGPRALPGTPGYAVATHPSAHVLARFTAADWTTDAEGFHVVSYAVAIDKDQYFRLRGTNLGVDVLGETVAGEPLADARIDSPDHQARFDAINERNYADLWFYSNPIFVTVE